VPGASLPAGPAFPEVAGKVAIVVDDGLATGSSMRAAVEALRRLGPARIVVAVPAAPEPTCRELNALAEEAVCAVTPSPFFAVGESYWDFTQTTDEEVRDLLRAAPGSRPAAGTAAGRSNPSGPETRPLRSPVQKQPLLTHADAPDDSEGCGHKEGASRNRVRFSFGMAGRTDHVRVFYLERAQWWRRSHRW